MLFKLEKFEAAAREYETMRDRFPNGEYAALGLFNAAIATSRPRTTAAIASYAEFLKLYPTHEKAAGLWLEIASTDQDELELTGKRLKHTESSRR